MNASNILSDKSIKKIHFIGIGGISMSGLAEISMDLGYIVSGSDAQATPTTKKLESLGALVYEGHSSKNITNQDLVVYSAAIKNDNPELVEASAKNIPFIERADFLGQLMKKYDHTIAVSGTHGKTTTTSMISLILIEAMKNPTIHIGGVLGAIGGSTHIGGNEYFVSEACEYVESFLKFFPFLAVILNIEEDHLDYFKDIQHIKSSFAKFIKLLPTNGYAVLNIDDTNVSHLIPEVKSNLITYGINNTEANWMARNITFDENGFPSYTLYVNKKSMGKLKLNVPGLHNISNSLAAAAACSALGCDLSSIKNGLKRFSGTQRRFETKGVVDNIRVIDDYAHHPTEIAATLKSAKNITKKGIWCIFQPHTYTRTKALINEFSSSFTMASGVIVTDIYAAREKDSGEIDSKTLTDRINKTYNNAIYISDFNEIVEYLNRNVAPGDMIITMGAGDVHKVGDLFLALKEKETAV